jgi:hypothetical protein
VPSTVFNQSIIFRIHGPFPIAIIKSFCQVTRFTGQGKHIVADCSIFVDVRFSDPISESSVWACIWRYMLLEKR